jgi:hypothetical protein
LLSTGGVPEKGVDPRLYGAYAALEAPGSSSLSGWGDVGQEDGCHLVEKLSQHPQPVGAWVMLRSPDPATLATRLEAVGFDQVRAFGQFVVAHFALSHHTTTAALSAGVYGYRVAWVLDPDTPDFKRLLSVYRVARAESRAAVCAPVVS